MIFIQFEQGNIEWSTIAILESIQAIAPVIGNPPNQLRGTHVWTSGESLVWIQVYWGTELSVVKSKKVFYITIPTEVVTSCNWRKCLREIWMWLLQRLVRIFYGIVLNSLFLSPENRSENKSFFLINFIYIFSYKKNKCFSVKIYINSKWVSNTFKLYLLSSSLENIRVDS